MSDVNIYKILRNKKVAWDAFESAVVAARSEDEARRIHPDGLHTWNGDSWNKVERTHDSLEQSRWAMESWNRPGRIKIEYIGKAREGIPSGAVIVSSYDAR